MVANHLANFQQAYLNRLDQEARNKRIKSVCGLVASIAGFVLGPALKEISDKIVDFMNPIEIATSCGITDLTAFLLDQGIEKFPEVVQSQLEKYAIPPDAFEELLREGIALTHPEIVDDCVQRGDDVPKLLMSSELSPSDERLLDVETTAVSDVLMELQTALKEITITKIGGQQRSFPDTSMMSPNEGADGTLGTSASASGHVPWTVENQLASQRLASRSMVSRPQEEEDEKPKTDRSEESNQYTDEHLSRTVSVTNKSVPSGSKKAVFTSDPESFPYHIAVQQSNGDVATFQALATQIDNNVDPHAAMDMDVIESVTTHEMICAAQYAYLLGYTAVGDAIGAYMVNPPDLDDTPAASVVLEDDVDEFPYILAVAESGGDVDECEDYVKAFENDKHTPDDEIRAAVVREKSSPVSWTVYEYASHLGYVALVQHLFLEVCSGVPPKTRITAIKQARERAKTIAGQPSDVAV